MIGRFPSLKMRRMIAFKSLIEQDYLFLLDFDPEVTSFCEQPVKIEYVWEGKALHYTPDFQVIRSMGKEYVECKPQKQVDREENQRKFRAAREWCQQQGFQYRVVTDEAIRSGHRLNNIKLLTRHARVHFPPDLLQQTICLLQHLQFPQSLDDVAKRVQPEQLDLSVSVLLNLAYHHQIQLEIDQEPITMATTIQFSEYSA